MKSAEWRALEICLRDQDLYCTDTSEIYQLGEYGKLSSDLFSFLFKNLNKSYFFYGKTKVKYDPKQANKQKDEGLEGRKKKLH